MHASAPPRGARGSCQFPGHLQLAAETCAALPRTLLPPACAHRRSPHLPLPSPCSYQPHGIKMLYDGVPVDLTPEQEEVATMFAVMKETGGLIIYD